MGRGERARHPARGGISRRLLARGDADVLGQSAPLRGRRAAREPRRQEGWLLMDAPDQEPAAELATLADLPFHVLGRHPKPLIVGRVRNGAVEGESTRDWFDRLRDLALGLGSLGISHGDRVAIVSESRPEWLLTDLAILSLRAITVP